MVPKIIRLQDTLEPVPEKTIILNAEREGQAKHFYYIWLNYEKDTPFLDLTGAIEDEDTAVYGWLSDDPFFLQRVYEQTEEVDECLQLLFELVKPKGKVPFNVSFMQSEFMSVSKGFVANIKIDNI